MPNAPRILGVDDNPRNLAILRKSLAQEFDLVTAASGEEALAVAAEMRPDLILLDIMMPGIDGYETCRRLRATPVLSGTKIILVSAKAMTSERLEGYAAGADDYVVKPFDQDEMLAKVRVYLRLKTVEEVDRLKSDVLDLLSHETATPLTGIIGALELLRDTPGLTTEQTELIGVADASAERLLSLVTRVSLIARLKSGVEEVQREPEDLRSMAASAIEEMSDYAQRSGITLELEPGDATPVVGDRALLCWVIEALLDNAIRFSPRDNQVAVRVWTEDGHSSVAVSDQGPGLEPDLLPRAFDRFVVGEINHHKRGSGLSLAAARLIADQHNGAMSVKSSIGNGAIFRLDLTAVPALSAAA